MSAVAWHLYGFGINANKINTTADKLRELIDMSIYVKELFIEWINDYYDLLLDEPDSAEKKYNSMTIDDFCNVNDSYGDYQNCGLAGIIHLMIGEMENMPMASACDCNNNNNYIIMPSYYPWEVTDCPALQNINCENDIKLIFTKYIKILTDQSLEELDWGEQAIEGYDEYVDHKSNQESIEYINKNTYLDYLEELETTALKYNKIDEAVDLRTEINRVKEFPAINIRHVEMPNTPD